MIPAYILRNEGATDEQITACEKRWQIQLPKQYKDFLRQTDGAIIDDRWNFILDDPLTKKKKAYQITGLFSLSTAQNGIERMFNYIREITSVPFVEAADQVFLLDLDYETEMARYKCQIETYWPIGCTDMSLFTIGISGDDYGRIVLLMADPLEKDQFIRKVYLANSFNEFLHHFTKDTNLT